MDVDLYNVFQFDNSEGKACNTLNCIGSCSICRGWYFKLKNFNYQLSDHIKDYSTMCSVMLYSTESTNYTNNILYKWGHMILTKEYTNTLKKVKNLSDRNTYKVKNALRVIYKAHTSVLSEIHSQNVYNSDEDSESTESAESDSDSEESKR